MVGPPAIIIIRHGRPAGCAPAAAAGRRPRSAIDPLRQGGRGVSSAVGASEASWPARLMWRPVPPSLTRVGRVLLSSRSFQTESRTSSWSWAARAWHGGSVLRRMQLNELTRRVRPPALESAVCAIHHFRRRCSVVIDVNSGCRLFSQMSRTKNTNQNNSMTTFNGTRNLSNLSNPICVDFSSFVAFKRTVQQIDFTSFLSW